MLSQVTRLVFNTNRANQRNTLNDTHRKKLCFTQLSTRIYCNKSLATSDLFSMFTQSIKFYKFHCYILNSKDVLKGDSSNRQKMKGCSFHQLLRQNLGWFLS